MRVAIVVSGLVRFPEQGFHFLKKILNYSVHDVDIYAGLWDTDSIPDNISRELKSIAMIPCSLKDELQKLILDNNILIKGNVTNFIESHLGLISHMATCSEFSKDLLQYDAVIKWRWDLAVLYDHFDLFCALHNWSKNTLTTDDLIVQAGSLHMNEVVFISDPELMIKSFTPVRERFLALASMLDLKLLMHGDNFKISTFDSHASLVSSVYGNIKISQILWALLRKNILDNLHLLDTNEVHKLIKLQKDYDLVLTKEKMKKQQEQDLQNLNK